MKSYQMGARSVISVALLTAAASASAGAPDARTYGFFDAYAVHHEERIAERDLGFGGRIGLGFPVSATRNGTTAVEVGLFSNPIERKGSSASDEQIGMMLDVVHAWNLGFVAPYALAGLGAVQENIEGTTEDPLSFALEFGAGVRLHFIDALNLRIGASAQHVYNNNVHPTKSQFTDVRAIVGIAVPFGSGAAPAPVAAVVSKDADGDGVPDSVDRCPAQPAPTSDGCPTPVVPAAPAKDTDADGIDDSKDECPGTLGGLEVDANGCVAQASAQKVVLKGVNFLPNSAELTPAAKTVLDEAYDALAGQASLKVEIGGHTDSSGDEKVNLALSQRRADSVRKYLVGKGIAADRLSAKGYGEAQPIADNKTKDGRTQNRRVEFKLM
jgi:OOP family OmpA-OmpF porin